MRRLGRGVLKTYAVKKKLFASQKFLRKQCFYFQTKSYSQIGFFLAFFHRAGDG